MGGGLRAPSPACQDPGEGVLHQTSCCPLPRGQASDPALSAGSLEWLGPHHPELPQHSSLRESRPVLTASLSPPWPELPATQQWESLNLLLFSLRYRGLIWPLCCPEARVSLLAAPCPRPPTSCPGPVRQESRPSARFMGVEGAGLFPQLALPSPGPSPSATPCLSTLTPAPRGSSGTPWRVETITTVVIITTSLSSAPTDTTSLNPDPSP